MHVSQTLQTNSGYMGWTDPRLALMIPVVRPLHVLGGELDKANYIDVYICIYCV